MQIIWQLVDSAFPSGGFAHSAGLEAAWQHGEVTNESTLRRFVHDSLWQAGRSVLPFVRAAHLDAGRLEALDSLCDAFLTNAVANRASRVQGRAFVTACARVWPSPSLADLEARVRKVCGHQAPIAGAALRSLDVPLPDAQRVMLFFTCRSALAAAVRLGIVGPYRAQRMQHECAGELEAVLDRTHDLDVDRLAQTAPLIDLLQSTHDRLYSRLFQS